MLTQGKIRFNWLLTGYLFLLTLYSIFSFSLTAPNLILSSWPPYWQFQTWMWTTFFNNRLLLSATYLVLIATISIVYLFLVKNWPKRTRRSWKIALLAIIPLLFSNNALSYDVFNYIFNAKMVWVYHANPHVKVALDFPDDDWTRFMHNTHTPAPYFYGWTSLSLVPYLMGTGKFLSTWLSFRVFSAISLGLLVYLVIKFAPKKNKGWWVALLISPLVLIEVVSNVHNDLWMMVLAVSAMLWVTNKKSANKKPTKWKILLSGLLLTVSATIKLATLALVPLWLIIVVPLEKWWPKLKKVTAYTRRHWALLASILLFLPLLTLRSKQFLPWYLIWSLVWIPFIKEHRAWNIGLIILSLSSMLRYVPYLWQGEYTYSVMVWQKLITWVPFAIYWFFRLLYPKYTKLASQNSSATIRE